MKASSIYLIGAVAFLIFSLGLIGNNSDGSFSITGAAIGSDTAAPIAFVMVLSIGFFALFFMKKAEVAHNEKR